jgi:hypothetical protein
METPCHQRRATSTVLFCWLDCARRRAAFTRRCKSGRLPAGEGRRTGQNTLQQVNAATKREYRGVNVLMLWAAAEITGYQDGRWATFKQWQQIGAQVRRGERGTPLVFCKELPRRGGAAAGGPITEPVLVQ